MIAAPDEREKNVRCRAFLGTKSGSLKSCSADVSSGSGGVRTANVLRTSALSIALFSGERGVKFFHFYVAHLISS